MRRPSPGVAAADISFRYGHRRALDSVSVSWGPGPVGVLGVNGAGKTTLLRLLAGVEVPATGRLVVGGSPVDSRVARSEYRAGVGYLPQHPGWLPEMRVADFLRYFARLRLPRAAHVDDAVDVALDAVDLVGSARERLGHLSGGQRQRAFIAQALVHDPGVLVLDEPAAGLDPVQRIRLRSLITSLAASRLVFVSTHLVEDLRQVAAEITVLHRGALVWHGPVEDLARRGTAAVGADERTSALESGFLEVLGDAELRPSTA